MLFNNRIHSSRSLRLRHRLRRLCRLTRCPGSMRRCSPGRSTISTVNLTTYLNSYDFSAFPEPSSKKDIKGVFIGGTEGQLVADLATMFSSFAQQFKYDASKSQLWVKPPWFETVLEAAKTHGYRECRILMHGCRTGDYNKLAADPTGFDIGRSNHGAKKWGFYGACSDHIASDYASYARNRDNSLKFPDGTAYIGLLFVTIVNFHLCAAFNFTCTPSISSALHKTMVSWEVAFCMVLCMSTSLTICAAP